MRDLSRDLVNVIWHDDEATLLLPGMAVTALGCAPRLANGGMHFSSGTERYAALGWLAANLQIADRL